MERKEDASGRQDSLKDCVGQFPPGDELDVLFLKQLAEFLAGEEIEIALTPGGTPSVALWSMTISAGVKLDSR